MPNQQISQIEEVFNRSSVEQASIGKDEIMQLLNGALAKGEPFATEFNDRVIKPLTRKIEQKLFVTPVQVDGKQIGQYITDSLQDQTVKSINITSKKLGKQIEGLSDQFGASQKSSTKQFNLAEMMGLKTSSTEKTKIKWNKLQQKIIDKAQAAVKDVDFELDNITPYETFFGRTKFKSKITLSKFLSLDQQLNTKPAKKWNNLQQIIIDKAIAAVKGVDFELDELGTTSYKTFFGRTKFKSKITLSKFLSLDGQLLESTNTKWNKLQEFIIKKAKKAVNDVEFELGENEEVISLNQFFNIDKTTSKLTKHKWNVLQKEVIDKFRKVVKGLKEKDVLKLFKSLHKLETVELETVLPKKRDDKVEPVEKAKKKEDSDEYKTLLEKEPIVIVGSFEKEALQQLQGLVGAEKVSRIRDVKEDKPKEGLLSKLFNFDLASLLPLLGGLLAGGALLTGLSGLLDSGPLKGLKKIGGKVLGQLAIKLIGKFFTKKALKLIPGIGLIMSLGYGISRLMAGDIEGGLLEFGSGIASLVPVVGTWLSFGIDALLAARDLKGGGSKEFAKTSKFNIAWKEKLIPYLESVPIIGWLIKIPKMLGAFSTGDIRGGLDYAKTISPLAPAAYAMSFLMDAKERYDEEKISGSTKSFGTIIKEMIYEKISKFYKNANPFIQQIMKKTPLLKNILKDEPDPVIQDEDSEIETGKQEKWKKTEAIAQDKKNKKESTKVETTKAEDFIWRGGQKVQPFDMKDNIIGVKDQGTFDLLVKYLKGQKGSTKDQEQLFEKLGRNTELQQKQLHAELNKLSNAIIEFAKEKSDNRGQQFSMGSLGGISDDIGEIRDPAYILRSRVWDRLRTGYILV